MEQTHRQRGRSRGRAGKPSEQRDDRHAKGNDPNARRREDFPDTIHTYHECAHVMNQRHVRVQGQPNNNRIAIRFRGGLCPQHTPAESATATDLQNLARALSITRDRLTAEVDSLVVDYLGVTDRDPDQQHYFRTLVARRAVNPRYINSVLDVIGMQRGMEAVAETIANTRNWQRPLVPGFRDITQAFISANERITRLRLLLAQIRLNITMNERPVRFEDVGNEQERRARSQNRNAVLLPAFGDDSATGLADEVAQQQQQHQVHNQDYNADQPPAFEDDAEDAATTIVQPSSPHELVILPPNPARQFAGAMTIHGSEHSPNNEIRPDEDAFGTTTFLDLLERTLDAS